ncbi:MAG: hypothetical protein ABIO04_10355 [Ferruginibacter sp.]
MNLTKCFLLPGVVLLSMNSCKKDDSGDQTPTGPLINFVFKFDSTQARLNSFGAPSTIPSTNDAQSPKFNVMSAHYVELTPNQFTGLGAGAVLYKAPETTEGGINAIDFSRSTFAADGQSFVKVPISSFAAGTYNWLRVSLAYQNYDIKFRSAGVNYTGTLASFIGFRTYIPSYQIKNSSVQVNSNKDQGYWGFETVVPGVGNFVSTGQAPAGATTVPNPLFATSPIPQGSCLVTGQFATPLVITGNETADVTIVVSLSTNKSFEWREVSGPGTFDPSDGDFAVDMGIRGLIPIKQ